TNFRDNIRHSGEDGPPWDELRVQWDAASETLAGPDRPGAGLVATAIADGIEDEGSPLRIPVGPDAEMIVAVRKASDDATFEATMRNQLDLRW
ncbi:MAG: hypothetical protein AAGK32_04500, partial [Actinomycetota bacterium]